jgi:hypothetical protein
MNLRWARGMIFLGQSKTIVLWQSKARLLSQCGGTWNSGRWERWSMWICEYALGHGLQACITFPCYFPLSISHCLATTRNFSGAGVAKYYVVVGGCPASQIHHMSCVHNSRRARGAWGCLGFRVSQTKLKTPQMFLKQNSNSSDVSQTKLKLLRCFSNKTCVKG